MHVRACAHQRGRFGLRWAVHTWKRDNPDGAKLRVPYTCDSWRCPGCRRHEAAVTFARIRDAFEPLAVRDCVFLVLTLDRRGTFTGAPWKDATEAYKAIGGMMRRFLKRLRRRLPSSERWGSQWVATVECHKSGWPHVNIVLHCPPLARQLESMGPAHKATKGRPHGRWDLRGWLRAQAVECGWGPVGTAEPARSRDALAGYITKVAGRADQAWAEVAKLTQLPQNAPERFRRLRSGRRFLPPRNNNPEVTGCLVRTTRAREGDWEVRACNAPRGADETVSAVMRAEQSVIESQEAAWSEGRPADIPPRISWQKPSDAVIPVVLTPQLVFVAGAGIIPAPD